MTQPTQRASCPRLTVVVPCHNEQQVLPETALRLGKLLDELSQEALIADPAMLFR